MTSRAAYPLLLLCFTYAVYVLTNYGGIRSPDSEVVFRVAEAMVDNHDVVVRRDLEASPQWDVAQGKDGRLYSVYPPLESMIQAAFLPLARTLAAGLHEAPVSHYVGMDLRQMLRNRRVADIRPHAVRYVMSFFDVLISTLGVLVLYFILLRLTKSHLTSWFVSLLYAFGTIAWSYAGSFFSEPTAILFVLCSYYLLMRPAGARGVMNCLLSGLLLGLAVSSHPTAILFAPFFLLQAMHFDNGPVPRSQRAWSAGAWTIGLLIVLPALGWYNHARFGDWLESGRSLSKYNKTVLVLSGEFWRNLEGVLIGAGKGVLVFCPLLIMSALVWRRFHKAHPWTLTLLIGMVAVRILFNAAYHDWNAGFCLGPRYQLMVMPFALIPLAWWLKEQWDRRSWKSWAVVSAAACAAIMEQWYFVTGEIFSFYHLIRFYYSQRRIDVFTGDRLYLDWSFSPFGQLLTYHRGPFLLKDVPLSNTGLWMAGCLVWVLLTTAWVFYVRKQMELIPTPEEAAPRVHDVKARSQRRWGRKREHEKGGQSKRS